MKNNYEMLDLNPHGTNVTSSDVKRAYAKLALRYHPDKKPPNKRAEAEELFQSIEAAYEALMKVHPSHIDEKENDKIISGYKKIIEAICHWPREYSIAAEKYLNSPTLLAVSGFLIEKNIFTEDKFITPLTRADWEIFCNQHYLIKLMQDYPHSAPYPNVLVQVFNEHEKAQYIKIRKANQEDFFNKHTGTESDRIWAHIAASVEHGKYVFEYFEVSNFLYPLKWRLLKEKVAEYRSTEGSKNAIQVANTVYTFSTVSCVGLYLDKVNEHIKLPFQKKINELMAVNDELSIEKANQITFALQKLEENLENGVCQFLDKSQTKKIHYHDTRIQAQILHEITKKTLASLANADVINQRRNLVGDILRGALGVLIGMASLGFLFLSSGYRNTFFNVDTKVLIEDSEQEVLYEYDKEKDFIPILQG